MASLTLHESRSEALPAEMARSNAAAEFLQHQADLVTKVLSLLPLRQILQLRLVCKAWNLLLRSPHFLQAWSSSAGSSQDCWLVMSRSRASGQGPQLIAYDTASSAWIPLEPFIQSLPSPALAALGGLSLNHVASRDTISCPPHDSRVRFCRHAASTSGLVCFVLHADAGRPESSGCFRGYLYSVIVLNLVTGAYHLLPAPKRMKYSEILFVSMQALPPNAHYRTYVRFRRFPRKLDIYDSTTRLWTRCDFTSENTNFATTADLLNADFIWYSEFSLNVYSADTKKLTKLDLLHVDHIRQEAHVILRHRDRVLLATLRLTGTCLQGFSVSELHVMSQRGNRIIMPTAMAAEVATTPPHLWEDWGSRGFLEVKLFACGSLIWMTGNPTHFALVYDIDRDYWYHLPAFEGGRGWMGAFSLQPSFAAPIGGGVCSSHVLCGKSQ